MSLIKMVLAAAITVLALSPVHADDSDAYPVGTMTTMWWEHHMFGSYRHWDEIFSVRPIDSGAGEVSYLPQGDLLGDLDYMYRGERHFVSDYMERNRVTGLLVIHGGVIRMEHYAHGADETSRFVSQSVAKSVVSTLVGRAIQDGLIESVADPIDRYVTALASSAYAGVPIEAVLQMSSGIAYDEDYDAYNSDVSKMWRESGELHVTPINSFLLDYETDAAPYAVYNYKGADTQALAWLLSEVSGRPLSDYVSQALWQPLGMESDASWMLDGFGEDATEIAFSGLSAVLRDYGRFGLLMAQDGMWEGKRLLPEGWVEQASVPSRPQVQPGRLYPGYELGYQYQWWVLPGSRGIFTAQGVNGQFVYIDPSADLVVVQTAAWTDWWDDDAEEEFYALSDLLANLLEHMSGG